MLRPCCFRLDRPAIRWVGQVDNFGRTLSGGATYPCALKFSRDTQAMIDRVFDVAVDIS